MGDVGSAFLGYVFAVCPLLVERPETPGLAAALAVATLFPFLGDTTVTFIRRAARGENVLRAHRSHVYQRLVQAGWRHDQVASGYVLLSAIGACAGLGLLVGAGALVRDLAVLVPALIGSALAWSRQPEARLR